MKSQLTKQTDGTIELTLTIPWIEVTKVYEAVVTEMVQNAEIDGFRKGKAPRSKVEEKLDKTKVYEEALKKIIPESYGKAVEEHKLHPIVQPKIELKDATEQKDWVLRALTCEKPPVTLGEYKKAVTDLKATKAKKIWTPGQDEKKDEKEESKKPTIDELLKALYENVTVAIPALLLEHEVNRLLSDLIDQTKKLGMSAEQYLSSTGRTAESIRKEYEEQAKRTLSLEFALEAIADKEGLFVSDDDIDVVIKTAKTDDEKKALTAQRYYIASVLRRQKTIDFVAAI